MGCSASRLDNEEAVRLCRDRKIYIKQAVEQRARFASGHIAYIESLSRVSVALRSYIKGDEDHVFFYDSCSTQHFNHVKRLSPEPIGIPPRSFSPTLELPGKGSSHMVHYSRSGGNAAVSIEERPQSPETVRIHAYYSMDPYGVDGFFTTQESHVHSTFFSSSPYSRPGYPPPSPQTAQWDSFWNPFSSLDTFEYPCQNSPNWIPGDDEMMELRQVREEEGIPDLEEEGEEHEKPENVGEEVKPDTVYDEEQANADGPDKVNTRSDTVQLNRCQSHGIDSVEMSRTQKSPSELKLNDEQKLVRHREAAEEMPGFTVYVNRRPNSMEEVIMEVEHQFMRIYDSAHEVSVMLEASRARYFSNSHELTAAKMLNPIALLRSASFRSASCRSTSSRFFLPSISKDIGCETNSDFSEESCATSGSHQSTLDRLYEWEKKQYEEVKSGERIRIAYEKKCMQLRNQYVNGGDPSITSKTRAAVRDLHTQIRISVHSVEAISKRIEALRDEELHPQLMDLIQGLERMWRTMADCHRVQKRTIDEAKLLLATTPKALAASLPTRLSRPAATLEAELRNWRFCFHAWVAAQRSYVRALLGWLLRCAMTPEDDATRLAARSPLSPPRQSGAPPVFGLCIEWSRILDGVGEARALEGLDFFAAGIASVAGQQREAETAARRNAGSGRAVVAVHEDEEGGGWPGMTPEKMAEVALRVMCAGMSVALATLAEFSAGSRDGYEELRRRRRSAGV